MVPPAATGAGGCSWFQNRIGTCPRASAGVSTDTVDVSAEVSRPGGGNTNASPSGPGGTSTPVEWVYRDATSCSSADPIAADVACRDDLTFTLPGTDIPWQPITIADLESFRPASPQVTAEPDGWAVVNLPANFVADSRQQVVPGVLLGLPAEVRFTPVAYTWDYGDGARRTTSGPGATWDELGGDELTATGTSHTYTARGSVSTALTVTFSAEYRFLGPAWIPVVGTLDVPAPPVPLVVVTAETMLVAGDCTGSSGPGC